MKNFLLNSLKFKESLEEVYPWDYHGLLVMMKAVISNMYEYQSSATNFVSVNRDKYCKRMKVVTHALERLIEDEYDYDKLCYNPDGGVDLVSSFSLPNKKLVRKFANSRREVDLRIVSKFIERYMLHCWH